MYLLDTKTLELRVFGEHPPEYAILSHRWGKESEEVTFEEIRSLSDTAAQCQCGKKDRDQRLRAKPGYRKLQEFCRRANSNGFDYAWADTCCIDKSSSAELSEAINSMFKWYSYSRVCYVYLDDVPARSMLRGENPKSTSITPLYGYAIQRSEWFTRGWTLQELLAPKRLKFFAGDWSLVGIYRRDKFDVTDDRWNYVLAGIPLENELVAATGISKSDLLDFDPSLSAASLAKRMSWMSGRYTTKAEDKAYCMLGILGINMPLLYGEGNRAFIRLQEELLRESKDISILAWCAHNSDYKSMYLLASDPGCFQQAGSFSDLYELRDDRLAHYTNTIGLQVRLPVIDHPNREDAYLAFLCKDDKKWVVLELKKLWQHDSTSRQRESWVVTRDDIFILNVEATYGSMSYLRAFNRIKQRELRIVKGHDAWVWNELSQNGKMIRSWKLRNGWLWAITAGKWHIILALLIYSAGTFLPAKMLEWGLELDISPRLGTIGPWVYRLAVILLLRQWMVLYWFHIKGLSLTKVEHVKYDTGTK